jgi:hypothetical protein
MKNKLRFIIFYQRGREPSKQLEAFVLIGILLQRRRIKSSQKFDDFVLAMQDYQSPCRICLGIYLMRSTYARDAPRETDLCSYLLQDIFTDILLPEEFLNEFVKRFHDDGLIDVIGSTIVRLGEEMASIKFNESIRNVIIRVQPFKQF